MTAHPPAADRRETCDTLVTLRDWLRHAVSRFRAAGLAHGHGASSALDEAAFIILETLHLPVERIEPFLQARLTRTEREQLFDRIAARIETRRPAAYLLGCTYLMGERFLVDERVIVPRSFIAEIMMAEDFAGEASEGGLLERVPERVLDLCTGSGCLAILASKRFPAADVDAVDLSGDALAVAEQNVKAHALGDRVRLFRGDLFAPLPQGRYDLILSNPPYVDDAAMAALPAEYRHEPPMALAGGPDGLSIVRRILAEAPSRLAQGGHLLVEVGAHRARLEAALPDLPFLWLDTEESEGEVFLLPGHALEHHPI